MQASLENLFKQLISENFLVFVDVNNFLQNTYSEDCFESRENFMRLYRRDGNVESKRGYVWIKDCPNVNTAFQAIYKHDCFVYKIRMTSFDETKQEEHLNKVCETATARGFTAFVEQNFIVFPIDSRNLNEATSREYAAFCSLQPVDCSLCEKTFKNEKSLERHCKLVHSSRRNEPSESPVQCTLCEQKVKNERGLKRHCKLFHPSTPNESSQPLECSLCKKKVKNERGLKRHCKLFHSSELRVREEI